MRLFTIEEALHLKSIYFMLLEKDGIGERVEYCKQKVIKQIINHLKSSQTFHRGSLIYNSIKFSNLFAKRGSLESNILYTTQYLYFYYRRVKFSTPLELFTPFLYCHSFQFRRFLSYIHIVFWFNLCYLNDSV